MLTYFSMHFRISRFQLRGRATGASKQVKERRAQCASQIMICLALCVRFPLIIELENRVLLSPSRSCSMQPSAGTAFAHFGGLVDELDCINVSENAAGLSRRLTCDLCEKEDPVYGCHGCDARFCRTCCVRLHSDAIIEDHVLTRLTAANTAANSNAEMSEDSAIFKISGDAPSLDSKKMACLDVHTRLGQSLFALQGCASAAQSLDSQIDEFSLIISRARCDAEDQARRDFDFVLSALSRRESQLMQHLQRLLQAKSARLSDYIEELDLRTKRLSDFLAAMNDSTLNDSALRESATLLERMMAPTVDVAVSDSLSDLLRACKFEVEVDIGGALRSIHGISSGRGQVTESEPHTSDSSFPSDTPFTATPTAHFAAKNISLSDAKPSSAQLDSPALSVSIGSRESAPASRDVSTPYVKSGSTGDRLILGGRPCTGALMEQLLHTLTSHHNLTSIDVTSSALGDAGALALASASLSCSHLCVLGMSQNNIGAAPFNNLIVQMSKCIFFQRHF